MRTRLGRHWLPRLFSRFPSGPASVALLLLRMLIGMTAVFQGCAYFTDGLPSTFGGAIIGVLTILCGTLLLVGFLTPAISTLFAFGVGATAFALLPEPPQNLYGRTVPALYLVVVAAAVAVLGPGAISVDARLFGMREVVISRRHRPPDA